MKEIKIWFFEKINLISLQPGRFIRKKKKRERERTQINKIRDEKGEVTTHINKIDSLEETEKILRKVQSFKTEPGRNMNITRLLREQLYGFEITIHLRLCRKGSCSEIFVTKSVSVKSPRLSHVLILLELSKGKCNKKEF